MQNRNTFPSEATATTDGSGGPSRASSSSTSEDAANDGGDAIDTFSSYAPSGLPPCVLRLLKDTAAALAKAKGIATTATSSMQEGASNKKSKDSILKNDEVIEILDSDEDDSEVNDDAIKDNNAPSTTTAKVDAEEAVSSPWLKNDNYDNDNENVVLVSSHTSPSVESALLSSVSSPTVPDEAAATIYPLVQDDKLSPLQAEGALLAIHRFQRVFRDGAGKKMRAGEGISIVYFLFSFTIHVSFTYQPFHSFIQSLPLDFPRIFHR